MVSILNNYEIKYDTTFKIGGEVSQIALPESVKELVEIIRTDEYEMTLGSCSNVLCSTNKINKKIIITKNVNGYRFEGNRIKIEAGVKGPQIARECEKRSLTGFEFLIGFPGSIGGIIAMNASAHCQTISDSILNVKLYDKETKKIVEKTKEEMKFSYRSSIIKEGKYIVLEAEFELKEGEEEKIKEIIKRNIEFRKKHQPSMIYGNAGSIFKNPANDSAGRLLDLCEMKGEKEGGAMVYPKHANFIINYNKATSLDVLKLMYRMYSKVKEKYKIELEPEIIYIGNKGTEEEAIWESMIKRDIV